jgi:hypothetical protein
MNGDDLRDRRQGDPARESARRFNLVNQVVRAYRGGLNGQGSFPGSLNNNPCDIPTVNISTNTVSLYDVLAVDSPLIDPSESEAAFALNEAAFNGDIPTVPDDVGAFGIAQQPIAPNATGLLRYSGVSRVQINVLSTNHASADITNGDSTMLTSCDGGAAQILWVDGSGSSGVGIQWAYVRLGGGGGLPPAQYQGMSLLSNADGTWSAGYVSLHDTNEGT